MANENSKRGDVQPEQTQQTQQQPQQQPQTNINPNVMFGMGYPQNPMMGGFGGMQNPMMGGFGGMPNPMMGGFGGMQNPMMGGFNGMQNNMMGGFNGMQNNMMGGFGGMPNPMMGGFGGMQNPMMGGMPNISFQQSNQKNVQNMSKEELEAYNEEEKLKQDKINEIVNGVDADILFATGSSNTSRFRSQYNAYGFDALDILPFIINGQNSGSEFMYGMNTENAVKPFRFSENTNYMAKMDIFNWMKTIPEFIRISMTTSSILNHSVKTRNAKAFINNASYSNKPVDPEIWSLAMDTINKNNVIKNTLSEHIADKSFDIDSRVSPDLRLEIDPNYFRYQNPGFNNGMQNPMMGGFNGMQNNMMGGFGGMPNPMMGGFGGMQNPMMGGFGGMPNPMMGGFGGMQNPMMGGFGGMPNPMMGGFNGMQNNMNNGYGYPQQNQQQNQQQGSPAQTGGGAQQTKINL